MCIENEPTRDNPFIPTLRIHTVSKLLRLIEDKLYASIIQIYGKGFYQNQFYITSFNYNPEEQSFRVEFKLPGMFENAFVWYFNEPTLLQEINDNDDDQTPVPQS